MEQFVHEFLRSKSVDEEVLEYVKDLLLDLIFEEEEEENETPDVESISENVGDMLEAFVTEEEVRDMCANALVRAKMRGRAEEDARRNEGEENGETETKKQKTFLVDLQNIILGFGAKILLKPTALRLEKMKRRHCWSEWRREDDADESNRGERYFGFSGGRERGVRETRDFEFIERDGE